MIYLDSSAALKVATVELESMALRQFLKAHPVRVSSRLLQVEVGRALIRLGMERIETLNAAVMEGIELVEPDASIWARAAMLPTRHLRALDAVHLATALAVPGLSAMVAYDRRLAAAAEDIGLRVFTPGR